MLVKLPGAFHEGICRVQQLASRNSILGLSTRSESDVHTHLTFTSEVMLRSGRENQNINQVIPVRR